MVNLVIVVTAINSSVEDDKIRNDVSPFGLGQVNSEHPSKASNFLVVLARFVGFALFGT